MAKYSTMGDPLDMLVEEAAEIIKEVMKCNRFGFNNEHSPEYTKSNPIDKLHQEIGDFFAVYEMLVRKGIIDRSLVSYAVRVKNERLKELFGYNARGYE